MFDYETKRTINEILDVETGEIITSENFFKKPESELILFRRRLAEAIEGYRKPKFVCAYCSQLLKLSGRATRRGEVSFFAHLYDSDDCEIKTNGEYSKEEIEIRKYSNIRESLRHKTLKKEIATALQGNQSVALGVKNVEIEKRITSEVPSLFWRQPDISAEFDGKKIVFELQLSTTFLSTIVDRDIFYRLNNIFIVWIFNFSDNQEFVNLGNLMCKDIYYANKRNIFIFDEKAMELSKEEGQLVLLCAWFEPDLDGGVFIPEKNIKREAYIRLTDLKFDFEVYKPFYIDADSLYFKFQPELDENRFNLERMLLNRIKRQKALSLEKEKIKKIKEDLIIKEKEKIRNGLACPKPFEKNKKWGYESNGIVIIEPTFQSAKEFSNEKNAFVRKGKKYGIIDINGNFILECNYKELVFVFSNRYIVNYQNEWLCIDILTKKNIFIHKLKNIHSIPEIKKISHVAYVISVENTLGILHESYGFTEYIDFEDVDTNGLKKAVRRNIDNGNNNRYLSRYNWAGHQTFHTKTVYLDNNGEELVSNKIELVKDIFKGSKYDKWGVMTKEEAILIPFDYDEMGLLEGDRIQVKKNNKFGYLNLNNDIIIPFDYENLGIFKEGKAFAKKNGYFGYIDQNNYPIIPFEYSEIGIFENNRSLSSKDGRYGYISENNEIVIPFEYNKIFGFVDGKSKVKQNRSYGYINEQNEVIIPIEYEEIGEFIDGRAIVVKNGKNGLINEQNEILIPLQYKELGFFINGKYRAKIGNLYGVIDEQNYVTVPFEYEKIEYFQDGKYKVWKKGKNGFINESGKELIDSLTVFSNDILIGLRFGKFGLIFKNGQELTPFIFDEIEKFINGNARVKKDGLIGLINEKGDGIHAFRILKKYTGKYGELFSEPYFGIKDLKGNIVCPAIYNKIERFENGIAKVYRGKKYVGMDKDKPKFKYKIGCINEVGKIIIPADFDELEILKDGKVKGRKNDKIKLLDLKDSAKDQSQISFEVYSINSIHKGRISNIVKFGLFIDFSDGMSSLIHISELKKHGKTCDDFFEGDELDVKVLNVDIERNRIGLTLLG